MSKAKKVNSYYEDGTKVTICTCDRCLKTSIEKDGKKSVVDITSDGINLEIL